MTAADTSVVVAAFSRWHERHDDARAALASARALLAPVAIECFSVLTRMPPPHRAPSRLVLEFLDAQFSGSPVALDSRGYGEALREADASGIAGGAIYDALVAFTARGAGATLVSMDRRAARTYDAVAVEHRLLA